MKSVFLFYSPICIHFFRRIKSWFLGPKIQIQHTISSILQSYRFTSNTMEHFLRIVEEPSQLRVKIQINASKLKVMIWDYAHLSFSDYQKLSVEGCSSFFKAYYAEMCGRFSTGSGFFVFFCLDFVG